MTKDINFEDKIFIGCISKKLKVMDRASLLMLVIGICDILEKDYEKSKS